MRSEFTRREWLTTTAGAAAGFGVLTGAGVRLGEAQQPKRGGTLRVATVDKPVNMDPGYAQLYSSLQVYQNVFNKLVYVDEKGEFIPGLAKSWKMESDKTWLFDLVDNAVFHNGEAMTSADVVLRSTGSWTRRTSCRCACSSRRSRASSRSGNTRCAS